MPHVDLTEYEIAVLKEVAGEDPGRRLRWGAAMSEALEAMKARGFVSADDMGFYQITETGRALLDD